MDYFYEQALNYTRMEQKQSHPWRNYYQTDMPHALARHPLVGFLLSTCAVAHLASVMFSILKPRCGGLLLAAVRGSCPRAVRVGLIPSLTPPVLGADGRLAPEPPRLFTAVRPADPPTTICSLLLIDGCLSVPDVVLCVFRVHVFCSCYFIWGVVSGHCLFNEDGWELYFAGSAVTLG